MCNTPIAVPNGLEDQCRRQLRIDVTEAGTTSQQRARSFCTAADHLALPITAEAAPSAFSLSLEVLRGQNADGIWWEDDCHC